ncbi:hypothetical protein A2865_03235 [Candidatus Woesebacteria bacterium RIFCSPHIGHO2_01_FULL_39_17]|uniref:Glycoside hydrolase family 37 n=3 Tax=Candidatus Woeseibacteriota TaxID=1752722 RepID=A0A0G0NBY8_9BACT|nr:MAG: Glycoside hydrolase family 37 [Microgenomates group bacterium GW2011_GWC1_38_12]KKQ93482.1 MAG: Glycoside hydrolase family 37 [Candidatus Woesebacteria bacterium GW2011_GWB1_39_10b]KKR13644.1 MAG: Glycoside hydrolase family 37 [Candidatus Woesebacteria bacterium GW2011_GWA1_39_21b]OGM23240.1 MAG: hypothetical protein A2865_03235 [Candidatus Woesebacteria bacterium RIFCSPHIGHO2_01_FULL_39_17]OGM65692.1 MAG: hypothetical protein A3A52_05185 [Candidatus Woesebacteria bacterium RIFCSPLOWO2_
MEDKVLLKKAGDILRDNLYEVKLNGKLFRRTVPSKEFYIHQWNWDSATHAMGLVYIDEQRAFDELESLVSGQWKDGLIAQITFNPKETKYFPGPQFWGTEEFANGDIVTSGITQPPLLAISFCHVYKVTRDNNLKTKLVTDILPAIIRYHKYLKKYRDPEQSGLLTVVHPWESGTDNSPRWDASLGAISLKEIPDEVKSLVNKYRSDDKLGDPKQRPGLEEYYKYMYLVWLFKNWKWDYNEIVRKSPFAVKDVLFNSLWCRANQLLSKLLRELENKKEAFLFYEWSEETKKALIGLWDEEEKVFTDLDVSRSKHERIYEDTIANFTPLWVGLKDENILDSLIDKLTDEKKYWSKVPVPTTPLDSTKFNLTKYWRGPTWPITNLFILEGLNSYQETEFQKLRDSIIESTIKMVKTNGFYEYYDPASGVARPDKSGTSSLGFGSFSWTAAISMYLLNKYRTSL